VIAVFQPHRYSRTRHLFEDFARAFEDADEAVIADIYPAGEAPVAGVSAAALVSRIQELGRVPARYEPDPGAIEAYVRGRAGPNDAVVVMGAGSITSLADQLARAGVPGVVL
jgi:UDP-N-acetylmuramate--alanine ligase